MSGFYREAVCRSQLSSLFLEFDLAKALHHIPVLPSDISNTANITSFGFVWKPTDAFGPKRIFKNFSVSLTRIAIRLCIHWWSTHCHKDKAEHQNRLKQVFTRLHGYVTQVNADKSVHGVPSVDFLDHTASTELLFYFLPSNNFPIHEHSVSSRNSRGWLTATIVSSQIVFYFSNFCILWSSRANDVS